MRKVEGLFAVFHGLGALGVLWTAASDRSVLTSARGALVLHAVLALGFIILALFLHPGG